MNNYWFISLLDWRLNIFIQVNCIKAFDPNKKIYVRLKTSKMCVCICQSAMTSRGCNDVMTAAPPANQTQAEFKQRFGMLDSIRALNVRCMWFSASEPRTRTQSRFRWFFMTTEHINPVLCSCGGAAQSHDFCLWLVPVRVMWPIMKHLTCSQPEDVQVVGSLPSGSTCGVKALLRVTGISRQTHCNRNTDVHTETQTAGVCVFYFVKVLVLMGFTEELSSLPWTTAYHRAEGSVDLALASWACRMWSPAQLWLYVGVCAGSGLKHSLLLRLNQWIPRVMWSVERWLILFLLWSSKQ